MFEIYTENLTLSVTRHKITEFCFCSASWKLSILLATLTSELQIAHKLHIFGIQRISLYTSYVVRSVYQDFWDITLNSLERFLLQWTPTTTWGTILSVASQGRIRSKELTDVNSSVGCMKVLTRVVTLTQKIVPISNVASVESAAKSTELETFFITSLCNPPPSPFPLLTSWRRAFAWNVEFCLHWL